MYRRLDKTLADYVAIAISPALIMTLVGSLVFFLLEVFYTGHFEGRLRFIMALFVLAAVLIGRISIEEGSERAAVFALPLAIVSTLAVYRFVSTDAGSLVTSLGLMALIWWSAHKLTWDCTLIDEDEDASGEGLMQVVGLDERPGAESSSGAEPPTEPEGVTTPDARPLTWRERLIDEKKRPHAPGVWIVYFSLAALPVFGLGQRFVPAGDVEARRYVFWLLCVYVASGFGLLLTTSFLGLRRYLRQRRLQMPPSMAGVWIVAGCVLIAALLAFAALLPRPASEYAVSDLPFGVGAVGQKSSTHAMGEEGVQDDQREPRPGKPPEDDQDQPTDTDREGRQTDDMGRGDESAEGNESASSETEQEDDDSQGGGRQQGKASGGDQSQDGGSTRKGQSKGEKKSKQAGRRAAEDESSSESQDEREKPQESESKTGEGSMSQAAEEEEEEKHEESAGDRRDEPSRLRQLLPKTSGQWLTTLFRWLLYAVLIVVAAVWLWRSWDKVRAGLRQLWSEWRAFWERLFGGKKDAATTDGASVEEPAAPAARPFASFSDPFASGAAARSSPDELVRYSFEALEAWARDHGRPRGADQTPHEFARLVGTHATTLSPHARRLADLYCTIAYAGGRLPQSSVDHLRRFWEQLRPVSTMEETNQDHWQCRWSEDGP